MINVNALRSRGSFSYARGFLACLPAALLLQGILLDPEETVVHAPLNWTIAGRDLYSLLPQGNSNPLEEQLLRAANQHRRASQADKRFDRSTAVELFVE